MRKRIVLICILIGIIAAICCALFACNMLSSFLKKDPEQPPAYGEWTKNGDSTHFRALLSDPTQTERENCELTSTVVPATCSKKGYTLYRCEKCGYSYRAEETPIDPNAHAIVTHGALSPTCTEDGWTAYETCANCSFTTYSPLPAVGHDFGDWTYDNPQRHVRVCARCSLRGFGGHDVKKDAAVTPTCIATGLTAGTHCTVCNHTIVEQEVLSVDPDNHDDTLQWDAEAHYLYCARCKTTHDREAHIPEIDPAVPSTCVANGLSEGSHCSVCSFVIEAQKEVASQYTSHTFVNHPALEPTCTASGNPAYRTCANCDYTEYEEIPPLDHDFKEKSTIPATCVTYEQTVYACSRCSLEKTEETGSEYAPHTYDAYTCKYCQKDEMTEYKASFDAHGNSSDDPIRFTDKRTLAIFLDYLFFEWITTGKYCTYDGATTANLTSILADAQELKTTQTWDLSFSYVANPDTSIRFFTISCANTGDCAPEKSCTITPTSGEYDPALLPQADFLSINKNEKYARNKTFDAFPYRSRTNITEVSSSDQLFYAFAHGYRPLVVKGSAAEHILTEAKKVNRAIISTDMSDLEKTYAIMQWIVKEVAYDRGAFEKGLDKTLSPYQSTAWYAEGVFDYHAAVCDGISKAVCILAGLENIKCVRVCGDNHAWNRVWIDAGDGEKKWYVLDATHANASYADYEAFSLSEFLLTDAQKTSYGYTADNYYKTASAVSSINPFATLHYGEGYKTATNDLVIENAEELSALLTYACGEATKSKTSEFSLHFFLPLSYCANTDAAVTAIRDALPVPVSFSYTQKSATLGGTAGMTFLLFLK